MMYSLLKETKTCQVCNKTFQNGKALAGHMRSHSRKISAELSTSSITPALRPCSTGAQKLTSLETILIRCAQASEVVGGPKSDLNKEGEQQVPAKTTETVVDLEEVNSTESQCGITIEECALCLLQMSEDQRTETFESLRSINSLVSTRKRKEIEYIEIDSEDEDNEDGDVEFNIPDMGILTGDKGDEDDGDYGDENACSGTRGKKCKKQSKYVCDICGKVLRSYQALGGHRTGHKNKRLKISDKVQPTNPDNEPVVRRQYKCDICDKVFQSGQALGGHRKVHYQFLQPTK